jgi:5-formyltetrahydrofolate cyclo-ligase
LNWNGVGRVNDKKALRTAMRAKRADFAGSIPANVRRLILNRPPTVITEFLQEHRTLGFYLASADEAPSLGWMRWCHENGWTIALPRFANKAAAMEFALWDNPWDESTLESGPFGIAQPPASAALARPDALIVPLVAFTAQCHRLGQGGGHYDRWLADHPKTQAIGLAWDVQHLDQLPLESHDQNLAAVVTPTQIYWNKADAN